MRTNKLPIKGDRYYSAEEMRSHVGIVGKWIIDSKFNEDNKYDIHDYLLFKNIERIFIGSLLIGIIILAALWRSHNFESHLLIKQFAFSIYSRKDIGFAVYYAFCHSAIFFIPFIAISLFHFVSFKKNAIPQTFDMFRFHKVYRGKGLDHKSFAKYINGLGWMFLFFSAMAFFFAHNAIAMFVIWFHLPESFGDSFIYIAVAYIFIALSHTMAGVCMYMGLLFLWAPSHGFLKF